MDNLFYLDRKNFLEFLSVIAHEYDLLAPKKDPFGTGYEPIHPDNTGDIDFPGARLTYPLKIFLFPPKEKVSVEPESSLRKTVIFGVKACDIKAVSILDNIFLDPDFVDPYYKKRRDNIILVSNDCTEPLEQCFCTLLGGNPFPAEGFDLNLSFIEDGVIIQVGSEKGKSLLEEIKTGAEAASQEQLKMRDELRQKIIDKLHDINRDYEIRVHDLPAIMESLYDSSFLEEACENCVKCCACTNICPSCHCFFLTFQGDEPEGEGRFNVVRTWDSCQSTGFARVAGGANPRENLPRLFGNRFQCKFHHKPKNYGILACTGCGRCLEACQGDIDIREVLTKACRQAVRNG